jgi:ornithine carbamoyltransferase
MSVNMKGKSLISINDLLPEEINEIFNLSKELKEKQKKFHISFLKEKHWE